MVIAISYARKSTDKGTQKTGVTIQAQHSANLKSAKIKGIEIKRYFEDIKTGTNFNRSGIKEVYNLLKQRKYVEFEKYLYIFELSRFGRNFLEVEQWRLKFESIGVSIISTSQNLDISKDENFLRYAIESAFAQEESKKTSRRTKNSLKEITRQGFWTKSTAPFGYNRKAIGNRKVLNIIQEESNALFKMYSLYGTGAFTKKQCKEVMKQDGFDLKSSTFYELFYTKRLLVYKGVIPIPYNDSPSELIKGKHQAIISDKLFEDVIRVNEANKKEKQARTFTKGKEDIYPLKGVLRCCDGKYQLTASANKGRTKHYQNYHHRKLSYVIPVRKAHDLIENILKELQISKETYIEISAAVEKQLDERNQTIKRKVKKIEKQIEKANNRLRNIKLLLADGDFEIEEYREVKALIDKDLEENSILLEEQYDFLSNQHTLMSDVLDNMHNLFAIYQIADTAKKRSILDAIFPKGIEILKNNGFFEVGITFINPYLLPMLSKSTSYNHLQIEKTVKNDDFPALGAKADDNGIVYFRKLLKLAA